MNEKVTLNNRDIQLWHGDCLELMKDIPDKSVDAIICDPPFQVTACKWDVMIPLDLLWEQYKRVIKDDGAICLFGVQPFTSMLVMSNPKMFKCEWIWEKNAGSNFGCVKWQPMREHENILVFGKGKVKYNPQMQERKGGGLERSKYAVNFDIHTECYNKSLHGQFTKNIPKLRYPSSIQKFNRERGLHPTQKPTALIEYLIKTYSNKGDTILDNTMGSGTTGVACINTNRKFIGIELDENYYNIACKRVEEAINNRQLNLF